MYSLPEAFVQSVLFFNTNDDTLFAGMRQSSLCRFQSPPVLFSSHLWILDRFALVSESRDMHESSAQPRACPAMAAFTHSVPLFWRVPLLSMLWLFLHIVFGSTGSDRNRSWVCGRVREYLILFRRILELRVRACAARITFSALYTGSA